MSFRKRKTRTIDNPDNSLSDSQIEYTFDEEGDFQNPFVRRARVERSPIITRNKSKANVSATHSSEPNMNNIETANQQVGSAGASGSVISHNANMANLETMLERVLTLNHNSFLNEIQNLRTTLVETITKSQNDNHNHNANISRISHGSPINRGTTEHRNNSIPSVSINQSDSSRNSNNNSSVRIDKWNLSYDGSQDIHDFLFKVDTLSKRYNYTDEQIFTSFHVFLKGKAETWFWFYLKQHPTTNYSELTEAIIKEFAKLENDCDKIVKMVERRQLPKESFDDYFTELVNMNSRLNQPMSGQKMIELIKNNAKESLGSLLFSYDLFSLEHLREAARKAERYLSRQYQLRQQKRYISEVNTVEEQKFQEESVVDISAVNYRSHQNRKIIDTSNFRCWNCDQSGHSFYDCPSDKRNLFCFRCGEKNVTTPQCKRHLENKQMNEK